MPEIGAKIYNDGGHFIAIRKGAYPAPSKKGMAKKVEEEIILNEETILLVSNDTNTRENMAEEQGLADTSSSENAVTSKVKITRKELFEMLYRKYYSMKLWQKKKQIAIDMLPYFDSEEEAKQYVETQCDRMYRNFIVRRVRLFRKVRLQEWNYFATFTYADNKHTEDSFRHRLTQCLQRFSSRKKWKYIGVWERGSDTNRLHFHAIMYIPEMVGELVEKKDFDTRSKKMQVTLQNTFFESKFGRADFKPIEDNRFIDNDIMYMLKYIEKSGKKLVYSRGLPQYFISDIMDEDIVCYLDEEERKIILFDDFGCWNDGEYIGQNTPETISKMPKSN